jgi:DNA polymerase-3 subunit beta
MKFTCEKNRLLTAILTASRAAATKSSVPLLEGLLIEAGEETVRISGYDLKTGIVTTIEAEVSKPGGIVLNARLFGEIIRKAPGPFVTVSDNSGYVAAITSEMSEFEILGSATSDYPELPVAEGQESIEISETTLKQMISQTNFAVSDNESRPIHTGALFETDGGVLTIVAVDGFRLALRREPIGNSDAQGLSFVVPGHALSEVEKVITDGEENVLITIDSKYIQFSVGNTQLISRRLEGEFLNYKSTIPQGSKYQMTVLKDDLVAAVDRVSLILSDKLKSPIKCVFCDGVIKLASASALGKASDECYMEGNGEETEIGFNDKYLLEALKAAPADELKLVFSNGITPCVIEPIDDTNNFLYMILPVRLKAYEN